MSYNFSQLKERAKEIEKWLSGEFATLRTGRVSPAILDSVQVESYGARMPIAHVAAVSIEDAKTLRIAPWDKSQIKEIEHALAAANLGVSVSVDDVGIRVSFPDLTEDRRKALAKIVNSKLEEAKVTLRKERERVWNEIQDKEKEGGMAEDDKFRYKDELQKLVDETGTTLESLAERKDKEIMS
ncbi:MAG: ribosome recycling factor [Candidatus Vogelbacteria bacterium]|nr:ribosome recycling factor [Candidatus Vogelbacteria bacterium]